MDNNCGNIEIKGKISSIVYTNEENGYTVLRLISDGGAPVTVIGTLPSAAPGETLHAFGVWTKHPTHGEQFKAEYAERGLPRTAEAIYAYLSGGAVRGIGPATAALIVDRFGEASLDVIENRPGELVRIKGISGAKAEQISKSFRRQSGLRSLMEFLCAHELRPILAVKLYKYYGESSLALLRENPYILAQPHIGGAFSEADTLSLDLGMEDDSPPRICAAIIYELSHNSGNGHCFIPADKLIAATAQLLSVPEAAVEEGLSVLMDEGAVVRESVSGRDACYLAVLYEAETDTAMRLKELSKETGSPAADIRKLIERIEQVCGMTYAPMQRKTIELAAEQPALVITGGPGTGKTTSVRAILALFDEMGIETLLTAPTGRAAKRMTELTGREATTVHRLLEAAFTPDGEDVIWGRDEETPLSCGAVVLDECSMVDITLMQALLAALPKDCRLIMVGDADQLPSVGPGNVFSDIIRSGVVPTVRLTEIFRQSEGSRIVRNAHMINRGEHPDFGENSGEFFFLRRSSGERAADTIVELCAKRLPGKMGVPCEEIQVLSPTRRGGMGTFELNMRLQEALNPPVKGKNERFFGNVVFREGDRVMQIRNNYDIIWKRPSAEGVPAETGAGMYNGDIGYILGIDAAEETLAVDFDGRIACYSFDQLTELEHAWAMTVHKSQGSEYRAVVLALGDAAPMLLTRGVLYTAVTRAKELLIAVGNDGTADCMIENHRQMRRYSGLRARLCDEVGAGHGDLDRDT
ncbi:MAG: ATP-dependent RecD-like DNA helicase [Clostridia bacterium]|nr:ATP-dependent RecD-like DNA helicase [Clostridia bacterium]